MAGVIGTMAIIKYNNCHFYPGFGFMYYNPVCTGIGQEKNKADKGI